MFSLVHSRKFLKRNSHYFYTISVRKYKMKKPLLIHFMKLVITLLPKSDNTKEKKNPNPQTADQHPS